MCFIELPAPKTDFVRLQSSVYAPYTVWHGMEALTLYFGKYNTTSEWIGALQQIWANVTDMYVI